MDNFYLDRAASPRFEDGRPDYESVNALDLPLFDETMNTFLTTGSCEVPIFDFTIGARSKQTRDIAPGRGDIIIVEGLHALNPLIVSKFPENARFRVYVSLATNITDSENNIIFTKRDIRFIRRMVRDDKFRDFGVAETFDIWNTVLDGEQKYLVPHKNTADLQLNSFHMYELCLLAAEALKLFEAYSDERHGADIKRMTAVLEKFVHVPKSMIPSDSLLREFIGH